MTTLPPSNGRGRTKPASPRLGMLTTILLIGDMKWQASKLDIRIYNEGPIVGFVLVSKV
jgi:hypothetical protein